MMTPNKVVQSGSGIVVPCPVSGVIVGPNQTGETTTTTQHREPSSPLTSLQKLDNLSNDSRHLNKICIAHMCNGMEWIFAEVLVN